MPLRIADLITAEVAAVNPAAIEAEGTARALFGVRLAVGAAVVTAIAIAAAFLPRRYINQIDTAGELIPQPAVAAGRRRRIQTFMLTAWAAGVMLPLAQLVVGARQLHTPRPKPPATPSAPPERSRSA